MNGFVNQVRKEQTEAEFLRLKGEASAWWDARDAEDKLKQYRTQLNAVKSLLDGAVRYLQVQLGALDLGMPAGDFYEACRLFDLRVIWLRKVWSFYRDKFDQRDDVTLRPVLKAADEVVWSCHRQVAEQAKLFAPGFKQGPAPLPFIEANFSPESFPSEMVPYDLKPAETGFLQNLINRLPIPLVSLPQSCVRAPWWLVYVGHEIGHHVQYALLDDRKFIKLFQILVEETVTARGGAKEDAEKWGRWSKEIFADVFSVLMMGQWAVWAMAEFEIKKPGAMLIRREQYPSPVARLSLLATTADRLGLDGAGALRGIDPARLAAGSEQAQRDLSYVPHVVEAALAKLPGLGVTLARLAGFRADDFLPEGEVSNWAQSLRETDPAAAAASSLRAPRLIASAATAAFARLAGADAARRKKLADDAVNLIVLSREAGSRGPKGGEAEEPAEDFGAELGEQLFEADALQLEL